MVVLGRGAVPYERGTAVARRAASRAYLTPVPSPPYGEHSVFGGGVQEAVQERKRKGERGGQSEREIGLPPIHQAMLGAVIKSGVLRASGTLQAAWERAVARRAASRAYLTPVPSPLFDDLIWRVLHVVVKGRLTTS